MTASPPPEEAHPGGGVRGAMRMLSTGPLAARVIAAMAVLAVLVAAAFAAVLFALSELRDSTRAQTQAKQVTTATLRVERVVDELDRTLRSFVLTQNQQLLESWDRARSELPTAGSTLRALVREQPVQARLANQLLASISSYISDYAVPLIAIAEDSPEAALSDVATREGLRRVAAVRGRIRTLLREADRLASARASSAEAEADRSILIAATALGGTVLVLLAVIVYLVRAVARPVGEVARGASRLAAGDLSTRIRTTGAPEIAALTDAFNAMASSVEQSHRRLQLQNEQLRQSKRAQSELIAVVSHELRTPLTSVLGYTRLMLRRQLDRETLLRYADTVHSQAERIGRLVEAFLQGDRADDARLALNAAEIDLADVVRKEVDLVVGGDVEHDVVVDVPVAPLTVHGDAERLAQVIENLVTNAIKYSPGGGTVRIEATRDDGAVRVAVRDEGAGIPQEHQPRVFTKFFRGEARTTGVPGAGLGLALARDIVEAHGGRIGFTSVEGEGSTFWFELPAR